LDHQDQNNFVGILKIMSNPAKKFYILAASSSVLHNYFDSLIKLLFWHFQPKFYLSAIRSFSKIVLSM